MYFYVYDVSRNLRFESENWPMARSALDLVISEASELTALETCPRLMISLAKGGVEE